jgi:hypothetical protein
MPSNVINVAGIPLCMPVCLPGASNYCGSSLNLCDLAVGRLAEFSVVLLVLFCFVLFCFVGFCFVQCNVVAHFTELWSGGSQGFCLLEVVQQKPLE